MNHKASCIGFTVALVALSCLIFPAQADRGHGWGKQERSHHGRGRDGYSQSHAPNQTYKKVCGQCHFALPAVLLPAASWRKICDGLTEHFGESLTMNPAEKMEIAAFLQGNAADAGGHKLGRKIMRNLGYQTPSRVTELPYIQRKHRPGKVPPEVFQRKSVGSMANCVACHPGAEKADFNDHRVRIPD